MNRRGKLIFFCWPSLHLLFAALSFTLQSFFRLFLSFLLVFFFFTLLHASSALTKAKKKAGAVERAVVNAKTRLCKKKEEK